MARRFESRRVRRLTLHGMLACVGSLGVLAPADAFGARPIRGAAYYGLKGTLRDFDSRKAYDQTGEWAALRISASGQRLSGLRVDYGPRGPEASYAYAEIRCRRDRSGWVRGVIRLSPRRGLGLRLRRDGGFSAARQRGRLRYRLRGRFVSRRVAMLVYSASMPPRRPRNRRNPGRCRARFRVTLTKDGQPPFRGCDDHQEGTAVLGPTGRIFGQFAWIGPGAFYRRVYACLFEVNRRWLLGEDADESTVELPQLAGPYAAFYTCYQACGQIKVMDLRNGKLVRRIGPTDAWDLVLKDNASVAWIAADVNGHAVWALDASGRRKHDSGPGIERESLTLEGSTLRWLHSGQQQETVLN
jgi:hypothetical protein